MTDCPLSGRGQGHVSNFYVLYLENVATACLRCIGVVNKNPSTVIIIIIIIIMQRLTRRVSVIRMTNHRRDGRARRG